MRYVRPLFIGILSFVIALNAAAIRAIVAIFLCSLLGVCFSASTDFSVLSHTNSAQASISFGLEGQEVAVPPIIREAPIDLQNSLADDFLVSRQTPFDSGRNEVLIISPSTGTEQRFEISLPTGSDFQLYQASFSKVRINDVSEILGSSDFRDAKSMLDSFSISFNRSNIASEITLADGSRVEFSSSEAFVYTADGVQVETILLSGENSLDETYVSTLKSHDKSIEYLLSQASSCESGIRNQIYAASQDIGRKSGVLRGALSPQGKAASWVSAFGERALEDSLVSETRNQTLQEIACVPPIECDEQQDYKGASEIRTDLFKIPGSASQQVDIRYQFYDIPDRMEIYYQGELVGSIPRGAGQTNGSSQLSVQLPGGADFVGVKLIGNEDEGTRWNYTISCSGECENEEPPTAEQVARQQAQAGQDWVFILRTFDNYYRLSQERRSEIVASNQLPAIGFARQMLLLAGISYQNRAENGGWAGDFARQNLLFAARDINENISFWLSPGYNSSVNWLVRRCDDGLGRMAPNDCGAAYAGAYHFERHLQPAFYQLIRSRLRSVIEKSCSDSLRKNLISEMRLLRKEHRALIQNAVNPGFAEVDEMSGVARSQAIRAVGPSATALRIDTLNRVFSEFLQEGLISQQDAQGIVQAGDQDAQYR